ncbi:phosphatidylglycerol lysyltransferase domain-containing protein [Thermosynechococcus sp. HN-54]|uniref:phosphatidylglycerol lysyltransferase domain-containing protein n=1 Tax=Thermosynechococcus sp. HN-54 TaxID=2933959 RepID=UPI00202CB9EF|nr:phosphatidylglycerol lysyltransferase domain-containing protein [Thermosynechococcus sp. HN-54]URR35945.1 phosphatidylglycerol lysyltransferase domain-containing protein [Thermosynechococcus sp. HN-54]
MILARMRLQLWITAIFTAIVGITNLVSAVTPSLPERIHILREVFPFPIRASGHLFAAISGFILLLLSNSLLRRKRIAWLITVGLLVISIVSNLIKGLDYEEAVLAGLLLIQLLSMRSLFTARSDSPSLRQGVVVLIVALLFTLAYGTLGFYFLDGHFKINGEVINFNLTGAIIQTFAMFFTEDNAGLEPQGRYASFFANSIYIVGAFTLTFALFMMLRPVLLRKEPATPTEREAAKRIIDEYGETSLARLCLLKDKAYYFSPSRKSVVGYVAKGRAAIALGDPIGPVEDRVETIMGFQKFCELNDWFPAFYEVLPNYLELYFSLGFDCLQIGEEAILNLKNFSLKGKSNQSLRTAINKFRKMNYEVLVYEPPIPSRLFKEIRAISDEWLKNKKGAEKSFSVGWFDLDYLQRSMISVLYSAEGEAVAFISMIFGYHKSEVTVDLMRYRSDLPNGAMEFLFVSTFELLKPHWEGFSFSLAPLAGVGESVHSRRVEKALCYLSKHLNQFYNFQGLHRFKQKFNPTWEPRYLIYPSWSALPDVVVGLVRADSGDRLLDYLRLGC